MVDAAKIGDFVTFTESGKSFYGRVKSVSGEDYTVVDIDGKEKSVKAADLEVSTMARMRMNASPNTIEMLENVTAMALYNKMIAGRNLMGPEQVSFLVAEIVHEYILKGYVSGWFDMLKAPSLKKDQDSFIQSDDFTDPLRKLPFLFVLQQLTQKLLYKKNFSHGVFHNIMGGYSALAVSNVADRLITADKTKKYRYP